MARNTTTFKKGNKRPGQGKRGPAKTSLLLKEAILQAGEKAGGEDGLVGYLENVAKTAPSAFCTLLGKVLPMQVTGDASEPVTVNIVRFSQEQRDAAVAAAMSLATSGKPLPFPGEA